VDIKTKLSAVAYIYNSVISVKILHDSFK